jgi:acyl-CoA thioester hydrolase
MDEWHETEIRVRYAETDKMGIVHNANYLVWFEVGRSELCRSRGFSYQQMEDEEDALMVVAECYCRYKSPAYYEDVLTIRTKVGEVRRRSLAFVYEIYRESDDTLVAEGETLHLVTDKDKKVRVLPEIYRDLLVADRDRSFPPNQAPS